jgi:hypothetical protein
MGDQRIFSEYSSDGIDEMSVCDGVHHHRVVKLFWSDDDVRAQVEGDCDGSCGMQDHKQVILAGIEDERTSTLQVEDDQVLLSHAEISEEAQAVLDQDKIMSTRIYGWYCKRDSHGSDYLLEDGRVLHIGVDYNWWSGDETDRFRTVKVCVEPACDEQGRAHWRVRQLGFEENLELVERAFMPSSAS